MLWGQVNKPIFQFSGELLEILCILQEPNVKHSFLNRHWSIREVCSESSLLSRRRRWWTRGQQDRTARLLFIIRGGESLGFDCLPCSITLILGGTNAALLSSYLNEVQSKAISVITGKQREEMWQELKHQQNHSHGNNHLTLALIRMFTEKLLRLAFMTENLNRINTQNVQLEFEWQEDEFTEL